MKDEIPTWVQVVSISIGLFLIGSFFIVLPYLPYIIPPVLAGVAYLMFRNSTYYKEREARKANDQLYRQALALSQQTKLPDKDEFSREVLKQAGFTDRLPSYHLLSVMFEIIDALYEAEYPVGPIPPPPDIPLSIEAGRYRDALLNTIERLYHGDTLKTFQGILAESLKAFGKSLPFAATQTPEEIQRFATSPEPLLVRLLDLLANTGRAVEDLILPFYSEKSQTLQLFLELRSQLNRNQEDTKNAALPSEFEGAGEEIVNQYLHETPLAKLFTAAIPYNLPERQRQEHTAIVAGSGHGKSQLLEYLILDDLQKADPPSIVLIDSKGDMVRRLSQLDVFNPETGRLKDRLIVIDPRDRPALNMFDVAIERLTDDGVINGVIASYEYLFGSLLGAELSSQMRDIMRPLAHLMLRIPNATLHTMIEAMDDLSPHKEIIETLPRGVRDFLLNEFGEATYRITKTQVKRRLYEITSVTTFDQMFSAPTNKLDLAGALNHGKIVLINTDRDYLHSLSSTVGRYFIAQTISAAYRRSSIPEAERKTAYIYLDEAGAYFDSKIDELLTTLRSYKLGAILAFQYLAMAQGGLQSSIHTNTAIKFMGGTSDQDARAFAADMHTTPSFIMQQQKDTNDPPRFSQFACYVRPNPSAVALTIPIGRLDREPKMTADSYRLLREENRRRLSTPPASEPTGSEDDLRVPPPNFAATHKDVTDKNPVAEEQEPVPGSLRQASDINWPVFVSPLLFDKGGELVVDVAPTGKSYRVVIRPGMKPGAHLFKRGEGHHGGNLYIFLTAEEPARPKW